MNGVIGSPCRLSLDSVRKWHKDSLLIMLIVSTTLGAIIWRRESKKRAHRLHIHRQFALPHRAKHQIDSQPNRVDH
ncbi:MAG: hypothetical protein ACI865_002018 [Flavobacteriaceae bacterium]|jgi:hypothetical protein